MSKNEINKSRIHGVRIYDEALPGSVFEQLTRAVRAVGRERFKRNYSTTFWFELDAEPTNIAEKAALALFELAKPGPDCIGMEWWLGRLRYGQKLRLHFDRDMMLRKQTGEYVHPLLGSALYLNWFPSSPMVIVDQVSSTNGKSRIPRKTSRRLAIEPRANCYSVFPGDLLHGVIPDKEIEEPEQNNPSSELRLSFLVNYWDRRPLPPLCGEYDGKVYSALRDMRY